MKILKISFFKIILSCLPCLIICNNVLGQDNTFSGYFDFSSSYLPKPDKVKKFKILAIIMKSGEDYYDSIYYDINTGFLSYSVSYSKEKVCNDTVFIPFKRINYYYSGDRLDSIVSINNQNWHGSINSQENKIKTLTIYDSLIRIKSICRKIISDSGKTVTIVDSARNYYINRDSVIIHVSRQFGNPCIDYFDPTYHSDPDTSYYFYNNRNLLVKEYYREFFFTTYKYQPNRIVETKHRSRHGNRNTISVYRGGRIIHKRYKNSRSKEIDNYYYRNGLISKIIIKGRHTKYSKFKNKLKFTIIRE